MKYHKTSAHTGHLRDDPAVIGRGEERQKNHHTRRITVTSTGAAAQQLYENTEVRITGVRVNISCQHECRYCKQHKA